MQLPTDLALPSDGYYAWSACRECGRTSGAPPRCGPLLPLSTETLAISFGRAASPKRAALRALKTAPRPGLAMVMAMPRPQLTSHGTRKARAAPPRPGAPPDRAAWQLVAASGAQLWPAQS